MNRTTEILLRLDEPFAAGLYEAQNATMLERFARALRRCAESIDALPYGDGALCPSGAFNLWMPAGSAVGFNYSFSLGANTARLQEKIDEVLSDQHDIQKGHSVVSDLNIWATCLLSSRFHVGGKGYTHSIIDYQTLLTKGLPAYGERVSQLAESGDGFSAAMQDTFEAVMKLIHLAATSVPDGKLNRALVAVAERPPTSFYEALVLLNFMFYVDGCDSIGALDRYLAPFYGQDISAGDLTPEHAETLLSAFFNNIDANSGWHMILGGSDVPVPITVACLRAQHSRRPNTGLKIHADTSDAVWEAAFDSLQSGTASPAFYNDRVYREAATTLGGLAEEDLPRIAYGGCTEFMVEGCSNVGSIDAGLNMPLILEETVRTTLASSGSFGDFMQAFKADIKRQVEILVVETRANQEVKAIYRPQPIRTLFVEDCLDRAMEYNQGGARYNGGVVNVAGIANVANSLLAIRELFSGALDMKPDELLNALENDFVGSSELHQRLLALPKFGNGNEIVDSLAHDIADFTFGHITSHRGWRADGFLAPSTIMFVTYVGLGQLVGATPDGRKAGMPIADSCGPMQGTDLEGPTALLSSAARLPHAQGLGTLVLNLRVSTALFATPALRAKLKSLILGYFDMGGLQIQLTVLDANKLHEALEHPDQYENLVVRVGGYTEYFNRLSAELKHEVIHRTEHL